MSPSEAWLIRHELDLGSDGSYLIGKSVRRAQGARSASGVLGTKKSRNAPGPDVDQLVPGLGTNLSASEVGGCSRPVPTEPSRKKAISRTLAVLWGVGRNLAAPTVTSNQTIEHAAHGEPRAPS